MRESGISKGDRKRGRLGGSVENNVGWGVGGLVGGVRIEMAHPPAPHLQGIKKLPETSWRDSRRSRGTVSQRRGQERKRKRIA